MGVSHHPCAAVQMSNWEQRYIQKVMQTMHPNRYGWDVLHVDEKNTALCKGRTFKYAHVNET